ncbi:HNH endonuclease [Sorangium sp. So ce118]
MRGYVGNTDFDWYSFLVARPELQEVNFWQPSGGRKFAAVAPGEPFFFKLKKPHYAVAGFGWFARHVVVPATLAWEAFGVGNGAPDFATMLARIAKYRADGGSNPHTSLVGCLMIAQPVFFEERFWIRQPADWEANIVQGKTYDVTHGEGRRILEACLDRSRRKQIGDAGALPIPGMLQAREQTERYGAPQLVRPRLGQGTFRLSVTDAYAKACAVTEEHSLPVLEAAHIRPYSKDGSHDVENGLLLRTDIHRLFDQGYVTVTPEHRFEVSRRLREDYSNGRTYYAMHGKQIHLPSRASDRPSRSLLSWHNDNVFLG